MECTRHSFTQEETLQRIRSVCHMSGIRGLGIQKRVEENNNFLMCLNRDEELVRVCYGIDALVRQLIRFFQAVDSANRQDKDAIATLLSLCGSSGENLRTIQNTNRVILILIHEIPYLKKCLFFAQSWIDDNELFFEDLRNAIKHLFEFAEFRAEMTPWVGRDNSDSLLFVSRKLE